MAGDVVHQDGTEVVDSPEGLEEQDQASNRRAVRSTPGPIPGFSFMAPEIAPEAPAAELPAGESSEQEPAAPPIGAETASQASPVGYHAGDEWAGHTIWHCDFCPFETVEGEEDIRSHVAGHPESRPRRIGLVNEFGEPITVG